MTADLEPLENKCSIVLWTKSTFRYIEEKDVRKEILKPITTVNSKLVKELQEWEVESTKGGRELNQ